MSWLVFLVLGLASIFSQTFLFRELMVTFYGNELFLGLVLGFWLFWTAVGSFFGKKLGSKLPLILFFISLISPITLTFLRLIKAFSPPGVLPQLNIAVGLAFLSLGPLAFLLGAYFVIACDYFTDQTTAGRAYLYETLGFALGGLLLNFFLLQKPAFLSLGLISSILLFLASLINNSPAEMFSPGVLQSDSPGVDMTGRNTKWMRWGKSPLLPRLSILILIAVIPAILSLSPRLDQSTLKLALPNLVESKETVFGRIDVAKNGQQYSFFQSGSLMGINQKTEDDEYLIHPILLSHPNPQKILIVGCHGGLIQEALKHQPAKIDCLEINPAQIEIYKKYADPKLALIFTDKRVNFIAVDPRKYFNETADKYNIVIFNLPQPSSILINRLYSRQAFAGAVNLLDKDGLFALNLPLPTDYLSPPALSLSNAVFQTLSSVFEKVVVLPEYSLLFLASDSISLSADPQVLKENFVSRSLKTDFITAEYLNSRLTDTRIKMFTASFEKGPKQLNTDLKPIVFYYQTAFWQSLFSPRLSAFWQKLPSVPIFPIASIFLVLFIFVFKRLSFKTQALSPLLSMATCGVTILSLEIILIFLYQTFFGHIYQHLSLLIALVLASMALGNYLSSKYLKPQHLKPIFLLLALNCLLLITCLPVLKNRLVFLVFSSLPGLLIGTIFPLVNRATGEKIVNLLYGADLVGAFLASILVSLFLIPLAGIPTTCLLLATLNLTTAFSSDFK